MLLSLLFYKLRNKAQQTAVQTDVIFTPVSFLLLLSQSTYYSLKNNKK